MTIRALPRQCRLECGTPKRRFDTRAEAKAVSRRLGIAHRIYRCGYCDYFHLARPRETT